MINCHPSPVVSLDNTRANFPSGSTEIPSCPPAKPSGENDRPDRLIAPAEPATPRSAAPAIPGMDAARAIFGLAAHTAFELQDGEMDGPSAARMEEQHEILTRALKEAPKVSNGADCGLALRRARWAAETMKETIRREILVKVDENTTTDEVEAALQVVKDAAVQAGKELKLLEMTYAGG